MSDETFRGVKIEHDPKAGAFEVDGKKFPTRGKAVEYIVTVMRPKYPKPAAKHGANPEA
jgi:hypothetical protein